MTCRRPRTSLPGWRAAFRSCGRGSRFGRFNRNRRGAVVVLRGPHSAAGEPEGKMDLAVSVEIETLARERDQLKQDKEQLERQVHGLNDSLKALDKEKEDLESQVETLEDRVTELELEISSGKNEVEELLVGLGVSAVDWRLTENALDRVAALAKLK